MALGELCEMVGFLLPEISRKKAQKSESDFCHRGHGARTQRKQETGGRRTEAENEKLIGGKLKN